jgi:replicative DNA helicase
LAEGNIHLLISRGVVSELFTQDEPGREVGQIFSWASEYARKYGSCPSASFVQHNFPNWRGEYSSEPVEALLDEFLAEVRRRYFEAKVIELSMMPKSDPEYWNRRGSLHEVMLEAAREIATVIPSGRVARFSEDFELRIQAYEEEHGKHRPGTPLGIPIVDQTTDGIKPGWVVTNAGFSGLGKSFLTGVNLLGAFEDDKVALLLSAEMSAREVEDRLHTMVMHWKHSDFMRHDLSDMQVKHWRDVSRVYSKARGEILILDRFGGGTIDRVHAEIERYKPDVCAIDYVQRMKMSYATRVPKWEQLENITNDLKTIAMDTDTAVIMVSQDGRDAAEGGSSRTNMGGSISVYQAADLYLGMMQDEGMRAQSKMRIKMLKFRHGPLAEVDVVWDPSTGTFAKMWTDAQQFQRAPVT